MQLPFLSEGLTRLHALRSRFDLAALAAPGTAMGIVRTGAGLCLVRLHCAKKSIVVTNADSVALPPETGPEEIATAAVERLREWGGGAYAAFGLDYGATVLRSFRFPFGGQRQINAVLPHEFADKSLLPLQQYYLAYTAPLREPDGNFTVTAAAANRVDVTALARAFSDRGVILCHLSPTWAALSFAWQNSGGKDQDICFVDLDHSREAYAFVSGGIARAALCLPPSGIDLLAGRIAFFLEQAGSVERIVVVGNEGMDDGLMRSIEDRLGLPVEKLGAPRNIDMSAIGKTQGHFTLAVAMAASLLVPRPKTEINFLTGDLAPVTSIPEWQNTARKVCVALCFVAASLCALEGVRGMRERDAMRLLQQELYRNYREALSDVEPTTTMAQMQRIMETRLRERVMSARAKGEIKGGTALDILTVVHQTLMPDMQGVADAMTLSRDRFTLSGTVTDFRVADTIREKLASQSLFEEVGLQNVHRAEQQRVRYEIEGKIRLSANEHLP